MDIIRGKMANQPRPLIEARLQDMAAFASLPEAAAGVESAGAA